MTLADINAAVAALERGDSPSWRSHYICFVAPAQIRALGWDIERVMPRVLRGEYVPADERHPPITAAEIRARRAAR